MAYENIEIQQSNFCIGPLIGTYGNVNTINVVSALQFKNDTGDSTGSFDISPSFDIDTEMYSLMYLGPQNIITLLDDLPFVTLTRNSETECVIDKWNLNTSASRLDIDSTITKTSDTDNKFDCYASAITAYRVTLTDHVDVEEGQLSLSSTAGMSVGNNIYLGPSINLSYPDAFEKVIITSIIDENTVTISGSSTLAPLNAYNSGDSAVGIGNIYLFSNLGFQGDITKGTLYTLDYNTGDILDTDYSGLYQNIQAATYGTPYHNTIAIVKSTELLYLSIDDYEIKKSNRINNIKTNKYQYVDIFDIDISSSSIYRLQDKAIKRSDGGTILESFWSNYNFQEDSVASFTDSVTLYVSPLGILSNQETVTIYAIVRDQHGTGLSGKTVHFDKEYGDVNGVWGEINKEGITDINGVTSITYTSGWFDPDIITGGIEDIKVTAYTDGSNILTGSIYVWANMILKLESKFFVEPSYSGQFNTPDIHTLRQYVDTLGIAAKIVTQLEDFSSTVSVTNKSKFQNPGGDWDEQGDPTSEATLITQLKSFDSELIFDQLDIEFNSTSIAKQVSDTTNIGRLSQNYVSRHLPAGSNEDDVQIAQYRFISQAIPTPFSEKNNVNSTIWVRLLPYGFDLNKDTLSFKVREVSHVGDTGYIEYVGTEYLTVTEFDAGGGLLGLEILYEPASYFHNNAIVYVDIEIYDNAIPSNRIDFEYWFTVIADYRAPYITNEIPARNDINISTDSNISFDILDNEVGVDISTLDFYVNNRIKNVEVTTISGGYNVVYDPTEDFYYQQQVEVSVKVRDASENKNVLYDMWRFLCIESEGPWIDLESLNPGLCVKGIETRQLNLSFNVYDIGTGIDVNSIKLLVDNKYIETTKTPIIQRIK